MPAQKRLDQGSARKALRYIEKALRDPARKYALLVEPADHETAQAELDTFGSVNPDPESLHAWIDTHMAPDAKRRMWTALRQQRHIVRHNVQRVPLEHNAYTRLAAYAGENGLTLSQAVEDLLKRANGKKRR